VRNRGREGKRDRELHQGARSQAESAGELKAFLIQSACVIIILIENSMYDIYTGDKDKMLRIANGATQQIPESDSKTRL
jgi:hypothetical protein